MADEKRVENVGIAYMSAYGVVGRTLDKIIQASVPDRFTQDFLATKLGIKGGAPKAVIPFLKRTGFLNGDGTPTDQYQQFRNDNARGAAAAQALRVGYSTLYEMNEYVHDLNDSELKGLVVQATGAAPTASTVKAIIGSFKALRSYADFEANLQEVVATPVDEQKPIDSPAPKSPKSHTGPLDLKLGYTINLNLPATGDIAVYNAIFKSLKEHLLEQ